MRDVGPMRNPAFLLRTAHRSETPHSSSASHIAPSLSSSVSSDLTTRKTATNANHPEDHRPSDSLEPLHDIRVVCAPEESEHPRLVHRGALELGNRAVRILFAGTGQPDWLHAAHARATEDAPRGDFDRRVRAVRDLLHEAAAEAGLYVGGVLPPRGGVFRVSESCRWLGLFRAIRTADEECGRTIRRQE